MTIRKLTAAFGLVAALTLSGGAIIGCDDSASDKADNAKNDMKDAAHDAGNNIKDAAHDVKNDVKDATH